MKEQPFDGNEPIKEFLRAQIERDQFPAIQYVVVGPESELFNFSEGLTDIAKNSKITNRMTMMIYSMTKVITAISILQLIGQEKIFLDDPVMKYLPEIPYPKAVKIRHLLSQTSGIPNPIPLKWVHLREENDHFDEESHLRSILSEYPKLNFQPGVKYHYSNISYWLLGRIVAKVSGRSFDQYVRANIFERLDIDKKEADFIIPDSFHHAKGYLPRWSVFNLLKTFLVDKKFFGGYENGWLSINDHYMNGPAFGGLIASAQAVSKILQDLLKENSKLLGKKEVKLLFERQLNSKNEPIEMTLGFHIGFKDERIFYFKEGGGAGFHGELRIYPKEKIATVMIVNNGAFDVESLLNRLDGTFLK
ncbi:serine hydrolase domain-containing protein [Leptospira sanjuanensis]|uniref:serine hydrolase domain-containing protein n=1 Tax=Leptospira sanjuanensis TaxID=2879643 RepID=UPI001EE9605D|nr:serine hydrolase domain-containing protein [Leptospira sanjuanensis]MCG6169493.1 beta-lactamase family protein [Leptospira sanjuanensis]